MQADYSQGEQHSGLPYAMSVVLIAQQMDGGASADHGDCERGEDIAPVPADDPVDAIGKHADVVHRADREADGCPPAQNRDARGSR